MNTEQEKALIEALIKQGCADDLEQATDYLEENYQGKWRNDRDYIENFLDDTGFFAMHCHGCIGGKAEKERFDKHLEHLQAYFDYDAYVRDMFLGGDIFKIELGNEWHYFWNH